MKGRSRSGWLPALWLGLVALGGCAPAAAVEPVAPTTDTKVLVCGPGSFSSGAECLPAKLDCPPETVQEGSQCVALPSAHPEPELPTKVASNEGEGEAEGGLSELLDTRPQRQQPRARALLITEIQGLESLFAAAPKDAADRPALMRRLAIGYVELSAAGARDAATAASDVDRTKGAKIRQAARSAAIKYYGLLVQQYPKYCVTAGSNASAGTGCADEQLYYLALEHVRAGDPSNARKSLLNLIQSWPQSAFIGQAYFTFGEMFRKESMSDPSKWALAEQAYAEAAKFTTSPIATLALSRRAEARQMQGNGGRP